MPKKLPSARVLRRLLSYDAETGKLTWKKRPVWLFKNKRSANAWNSRFANKPAFTAIRPSGYPFGHLLRRPIDAHRVIWCIQTGEWPTEEIDHIRGLSEGNRWVNLREVTKKQNTRNKRLLSNNTSGHMGVVWDQSRQKWMAKIKVNQRSIFLGLFKHKSEAISARRAAERQYGFSEHHGRTA